MSGGFSFEIPVMNQELMDELVESAKLGFKIGHLHLDRWLWTSSFEGQQLAFFANSGADEVTLAEAIFEAHALANFHQHVAVAYVQRLDSAKLSDAQCDPDNTQKK